MVDFIDHASLVHLLHEETIQHDQIRRHSNEVWIPERKHNGRLSNKLTVPQNALFVNELR